MLNARQQADAEHVDVLLDRGLDNFLGRAVQAGIDHVHAGVAKGARDHLDPAIVSVEADLGEEHPDGLRQLPPPPLLEFSVQNAECEVVEFELSKL